MKRFYKIASAEPAEAGWRVVLDGRPIRTALGRPQIVPSRLLAETMADEWAGQGEEIDATSFPMRDLADYAIDIVAEDPATVIAAILRYAETDTLCYRADPDEPLHARQRHVWEPLLDAAEAQHGISFERVCGIVHRPQRAETLERLKAVLEAFDPFTLSAINTMGSLAASLVVALAALEDSADSAALWAAANLEEDWQAELWGWDPLAKERRDRKEAQFAAAMNFAQLTRNF